MLSSLVIHTQTGNGKAIGSFVPLTPRWSAEPGCYLPVRNHAPATAPRKPQHC